MAAHPLVVMRVILSSAPFRRIRNVAFEEAIEGPLATQMALGDGIVTLPLEPRTELEGGHEERGPSQMDSKWQSDSTGRAQ